jgi:hypothetical protein
MLINGSTGARRRCATAAAAVAAVTAAGCGVAPPAPPARGGTPVIVIRDNASGTMVPVPAGDRVEVILSSRYWDVAGSSAPRVLRQEGPATLMPRPDGRAVIKASRTSCGEALRCVPGKTRFTVTVAVRD